MMNGYAKRPVKFLVFLTFKTRGVDGREILVSTKTGFLLGT